MGKDSSAKKINPYCDAVAKKKCKYCSEEEKIAALSIIFLYTSTQQKKPAEIESEWTARRREAERGQQSCLPPFARKEAKDGAPSFYGEIKSLKLWMGHPPNTKKTAWPFSLGQRADDATHAKLFARIDVTTDDNNSAMIVKTKAVTEMVYPDEQRTTADSSASLRNDKQNRLIAIPQLLSPVLSTERNAKTAHAEV